MPIPPTVADRSALRQIRCRPASMLALALLALLVFVAAPALAAAQTDGHGHDHDEEAAAPTAAERAAAEALLAATREGTTRFADASVAATEGYVQITPFAFSGVRAAHFHNERYHRDGALLDPERPEDLMYLKTADDRLVLIGVMFLAPRGDGPTVGGPLTTWHTHDDLCANAQGVVPIAPDGACPPGTAPITAEMLHVWLVDNPDGPFAERLSQASVAGLDGTEETGGTMAAGAQVVDWRGLMREVGTLLDLNLLQLRQRYQAGESLVEIAAAQGVPSSTLITTIERRVAADLDRAVTQGDMTAGQRDLIRRQLPAQIERLVEIHEGEPWMTHGAPDPSPGPAA